MSQSEGNAVITFLDVPLGTDPEDGWIGPKSYPSLGQALDRALMYVGPRIGLRDWSGMDDSEKSVVLAEYFLNANDDDRVAVLCVEAPNFVLQCGCIQQLMCRPTC
ncbi:hypothetical protein SAMN05216178_6853 [Pseudomonas saponiphila]|jgi:hypothetical protein|uniref:Uncharacterized protein n=1 Tax=Pseudomonas saponiphila TaxID=556534 RepID=A0A1H4ZV26_9PSED|nr:hypothetical protein SAMN05216178_6853 [Pseudomonas saponiphila]